jgi:succinate-acetate transporter protein
MAKQTHSFATPAPQALTALAIACFIFYGILTGKIGHDSRLSIACWLFGGFVCQFVAGIIELKDHNITGGNVMLLFGSFFMLVTALLNAAEFVSHANGVHFGVASDPYAWLALTIVLWFFTPAYLVGAPVFFAALIFADIALSFITLLKFGKVAPALGAPVAAYCILTVGLLGIYLAAATVLNNTFNKSILPVGKPLVAAEDARK